MFQLETGDFPHMYFLKVKLNGSTVFHSGASASVVQLGRGDNLQVDWSFNGIACADKADAVARVKRTLVQFLTEATNSASKLILDLTLGPVEPMAAGRSLITNSKMGE